MNLIKKHENATLIRHNLFELSHQIRLNCCGNNDDHYIAPITFNISTFRQTLSRKTQIFTRCKCYKCIHCISRMTWNKYVHWVYIECIFITQLIIDLNNIKQRIARPFAIFCSVSNVHRNSKEIPTKQMKSCGKLSDLLTCLLLSW